MKTKLLTLALFLCGTLLATAAPADLTYVEGDASLRTKAGQTSDAEIGDTLQSGDTLKTGKDGLAELDQNGVVIKVAHGTVFTLMDRAQGTTSTTVLSLALGSIKYKFDKIGGGSEPQVRTNGAVAGVRGTEFSVWAAADGSTFFAVDSGAVTIESEGKSVDLGPAEGVEVPLGKPPGEKVVVHSEVFDHAKWNADKVAAMLADPLAAMDAVIASLAEYGTSVADYAARFAASSLTLKAEREKRNGILKDQGKDAATQYENEVITPLSLNTGYLFLNTRYYALAALALRRFVAGRLYVTLKAQYIANPQDPHWLGFLDKYSTFLKSFEQSIVPQLVAGDI
jgi:hypothetical protein